MLKTIAEVSPNLITFILALKLSLSRPQQRRVVQVADALITTEGSKSLAEIIRLHRDAHAGRLLEEACHMVLQVGNIPDVLARFTLTPAT